MVVVRIWIVIIRIIKFLFQDIIILIIILSILFLVYIFVKLMETKILLKKLWLIKIFNTIMALFINIKLIFIELYAKFIFTLLSHYFKNIRCDIVIWYVHIILMEDLIILFYFSVISFIFTYFLVIHSLLIAVLIFVIAFKYTFPIAHF